MGSLSLWHWIIVILVWAAWITPLYHILGRIGFSKAWAFLALFPPLGMVILWVIAFVNWPYSSKVEHPPLGYLDDHQT